MAKANPRRYTANSKAGRQIMAANFNRSYKPPTLTQEQLDWNALIEAKRQAKLERKASK